MRFEYMPEATPSKEDASIRLAAGSDSYGQQRDRPARQNDEAAAVDHPATRNAIGVLRYGPTCHGCRHDDGLRQISVPSGRTLSTIAT
jgi:hypothetical protein